jgi:hypothetical protein
MAPTTPAARPQSFLNPDQDFQAWGLVSVNEEIAVDSWSTTLSDLQIVSSSLIRATIQKKKHFCFPTTDHGGLVRENCGGLGNIDLS